MSVPWISAFTSGTSRAAAQHAATKNYMKPRLTPCFFWNESL